MEEDYNVIEFVIEKSCRAGPKFLVEHGPSSGVAFHWSVASIHLSQHPLLHHNFYTTIDKHHCLDN